MALLEFARSLVGVTHDATPVTLAFDPENRAAGRQPTDGDDVPCVVVDMPGNEARSLGLEVPVRLRRVFFDPTTGGEPPVDTNDQLRVRGETLDVLSVQRVESGSMAGSIVIGRVGNT